MRLRPRDGMKSNGGTVRWLATLSVGLLGLAFMLSALAPPSSIRPMPGVAFEDNEFVARYFALAKAAEQAGKVDDARANYARVLEREARHLPTLYALTKLEHGAQQLDDALEYAGQFVWTMRYVKDAPADLRSKQAELVALVRSSDPLRTRYDSLRREYVTRLLKLANEQMDHLAWHSARSMLLEARATDPEHPELAAGLQRIKLEGGNELAVEDETGGSDPLAGVSPEWLAENDAKHVDWDKAWVLETEHYKFRTNAGYRVLKTAARAMEQVQVFYRIFHQYKTKNESIPVANVHIFKSADEYRDLGNRPVDWAAGHWDGTSVVTYDARNGGEGGLAGMLDTLFHEASHQFTTLCGGGSVPAWLNEGMASFFEGTKLLSNGKLDWNLVVPGRLYPLVEELHGSSPNKLANVIQGQVPDYRVYYPWGWGLCYFFYNAEDAQGRLVYRPQLKEYFQEYHSDQHLERFLEYFVTRPKVPGIATIEDFERAFIAYVFDLEAQDKGKVDAARRYEERGDQQFKLGDHKRAIDLFSRSLEKGPDSPGVLWKLADALEKDKLGDRAAGVLRQWMTVTQVDLGAPDPEAERRALAEKRIVSLDTSAKRLAELRVKFHAESDALASEYEKAKLPRMALTVLRGPATAQPPSQAAIEHYFRVADKSGVALERWRLIFDEKTLKGFYGGGESDFKVEDGVIVGHVGDGKPVVAPKTGSDGSKQPEEKKSQEFAFRRLFIDVQPAGDWSLAADILVNAQARLGGLCFGKKADGLFHGVGLLPEGYIDLTQFGGTPKTLVRTKIDLKPGWHKLRIDVAGTRLVASIDAAQALEWDFSSRAELKGDFGLLAGLGTPSFREIKLLEYDPNLPRRVKIGRRKTAVEPIEASMTEATIARAEPGRATYLNEAPPLLRVDGWIGTPPKDGNLDALRFWPTILLFANVNSETKIPQLPGLLKIAATYKELDIPILILFNDKPESVEAWVKSTNCPFPVAHGWSQKNHQDYKMDALPNAKLLDLEGKVVWEGHPDFKEEYGSYLDEPLGDLVKRARLVELQAAAPKLAAAAEAETRLDIAAAVLAYQEIAKLDVTHPTVAAAKSGIERIETLGGQRIASAEDLSKQGRVLQAGHMLEETSTKFAALPSGERAKLSLEKLAKGKAAKDAKKLEARLKSAENSIESKKDADAKESLESTLGKLEAGSDPWVRERSTWLLEALASGKVGKDLLALYKEQFPGQ